MGPQSSFGVAAGTGEAGCGGSFTATVISGGGLELSTAATTANNANAPAMITGVMSFFIGLVLVDIPEGTEENDGLVEPAEAPPTQPADEAPKHMPLAKKGPFAHGEKIPVATWVEIERDCVAGMTLAEASEKWKIKRNTIQVKAKRDGWIMPGRIRDVLRRHDHTALTAATNSATRDWLAKGERHREKVFGIAEASLKPVKKIKIKNAKDLELVDKVGRRAAGLDTAEIANLTLIQLNEQIDGYESEQPIEATEVEAEVTPIDATGGSE
jgi:hypothetical protein